MDNVISKEAAIARALPIIRRQMTHGLHGQDRRDASDWMFLYGEVAEEYSTRFAHSPTPREKKNV